MIAEKWELSYDVAGATLMAAGGSAPELFTSFFGSFQNSPIGFAAIVGSAVFNVLFVIGVCALVIPEPLQLTWYPLARDCIFYSISLGLLSVFFAGISRSQIYAYEASILLLLYVGYVILMKYNHNIYDRWFKSDKDNDNESNNINMNSKENSNNKKTNVDDKELDIEITNNDIQNYANNDDSNSDENSYDNYLEIPKGSLQKLWYFLTIILIILFVWTIPDATKKDKYRYISFIVSIIYIGSFTYFMVLWAEIIGDTFKIPEVIMGLTVLAAGTSIPDLLSSVAVAKQGYADMAISSSIGSNIFDILIGLPLPWLLYNIIYNKSVNVTSDGLEISVVILLGIVVVTIVLIYLNKWFMTKMLGITMIIFYCGFIAQDLIRSKWVC